MTEYLTTTETGKVLLADNAPDWLYDAIREAHNGKLPNDVSYEMIKVAMLLVQDNPNDEALDEAVFNSAPVYTSQLVRYLSSHLDRFHAVDEELRDGSANTLTEAITLAYVREMEYIVQCLKVGMTNEK